MNKPLTKRQFFKLAMIDHFWNDMNLLGKIILFPVWIIAGVVLLIILPFLKIN